MGYYVFYNGSLNQSTLMLDKYSALMNISPAILRRNIVRILTNELISTKLLSSYGFSPEESKTILSVLSYMEIYNLYSKEEIDIMFNGTIEKVFCRNREMLNEQRRDFDAKMALMHEQDKKNHDYLKSARRWVIGTIITVGMGLPAYLSVLIKLI